MVKKITKQDYIKAYYDFEVGGGREPRQDLINGIFSNFVRAELRPLTEDEFRRLIFVYSPDNEVTIKLTNSGTQRLLADVTLEYLAETNSGWSWDDNENKIKPMIKKLASGELKELPQIFLRQKLEYEPQDGSFYIEDGIHRSLALSAFCYEKNRTSTIEAYIGYFT